MVSKLDSAQKDWVEAKVMEGFGLSNTVNSVLLDHDGVPAMPGQDDVIRRAQAELAEKKAAVEFMMNTEDGEGSVFTYQTKLVVPSGQRVKVAKVLLDGQSNTMKMSGEDLRPTLITDMVAEHLDSRPSRVDKPTWHWEFGQGDQIVEAPSFASEGQRVLNLARMHEIWMNNLPEGMRGTDLETWSTRMAAGIREGKPLDVRFAGDATSVDICEIKNFTLLDEEKLLREPYKNNPCLIGGTFYPSARRVFMGAFVAYLTPSLARWRLSIDGPIRS